MKQLIYASVLFATCATVFGACKKKEVSNRNDQSRELEYRLDNIPIIKIPPSINSQTKDGTDLDEQKLNQQLIDLAKATKDLIKNPTFNALIISIAKESDVDVVYYSQIKQQGLAFYDEINRKLTLKGLSIESITMNMTHEPILPNPVYPETGELEIYEPAIFVPNSSSANSNLQPLISPNIETEIDEEDYIVMWYYNQNGVQNETMINEETVNNTSNPIFILDHTIPKVEMDKIGAYIKSTKGASPFPKSGSAYFESNRIKIKNGYRYEQGLAGRSEFCIGGVIVRQGSPPANFLYLTNNNDYSLKIKEVTKSQVSSSSSVYVTSHHSDNYEPYAQNKVFWNTFERDWNRSIKDLGKGTTFGQNWYFWGRMRYDNDWYQWIPETVPIHETPFEWFGWETVIPFSSWKSEYDLIKVN